METFLAAGLVLSPIGLLIFIGIPSIAIYLAKSKDLPPIRLAFGYIGALLALAMLFGFTSYVTPQEAAAWGVKPDDYFSATLRQFIAIFSVTAFFSVIGISTIGLPVLFELKKSGRGTAPWLILVSVAISATAALIFYAALRTSSNIKFTETLWVFVSAHGVMAVGFAIGSRLPWKLSAKA